MRRRLHAAGVGSHLLSGLPILVSVGDREQRHGLAVLASRRLNPRQHATPATTTRVPPHDPPSGFGTATP